jgi:two-component system, NarL family, sensor kinase
MTSLQIACSSQGVYFRLPALVESSLYRIAQEALANVYRHAKASRVQVRLESAENMLRLVVEDDGVGISAKRDRVAGPGVGILNIRMRVRELGGRYECRRLKRGTRFTVVIPRACTNELPTPWGLEAQ